MNQPDICGPDRRALCTGDALAVAPAFEKRKECATVSKSGCSALMSTHPPKDCLKEKQ